MLEGPNDEFCKRTESPRALKCYLRRSGRGDERNEEMLATCATCTGMDVLSDERVRAKFMIVRE